MLGYRRWSDDEDEFLRANPELPAKVAGKRLNRSERAVQTRRWFLDARQTVRKSPSVIRGRPVNVNRPWTEHEDQHLFARWRTTPDSIMARDLHRTTNSVRMRRNHYKLDRKSLPRSKNDATAVYVPTTEQIAAACAELREQWSEEEERKRRAVSDGAALAIRFGRASHRIGRVGVPLYSCEGE